METRIDSRMRLAAIEAPRYTGNDPVPMANIKLRHSLPFRSHFAPISLHWVLVLIDQPVAYL